MKTAMLVEHLHGSLPNASLAFVVSALRQDPTIWESLQDPDFWQLITAQSRSDPEDWSPASLALAALQPEEASTLKPLSLQADLQFPLESGLRRRAAKVFEGLANGEDSILLGCSDNDCHAPTVLAHSALLALALRERRRLTGSWNKLSEELAKTSSAIPASDDHPQDNPLSAAQDPIYLTWHTPLACLYGLVPDSFKLLHSLLAPGASPIYHALVVHILLSNPLPPEKVHNQLRALISALPLADSIQLLDQVSLKRPGTAGLLAGELISLSRDSGLAGAGQQPALPAQANYPVYLQYMEQLLLFARVNQLAEKPLQVQPFLNTALEASNRLQAELACLIAQNASQRGDTAAVLLALRQATQLAPDNPIYQARLVTAETKEINPDDPSKPGETQSFTGDAQGMPSHPALLLAAARLAAKNGDLEKARSYAQALLDQLTATPSADSENTARLYLTSSNWLTDDTTLPGKTFAALLLKLGLPVGALSCMDLLSTMMPDDPQLLAMQAKAQAQVGTTEDAVGSLMLALALNPDQPVLHRQLAGYYELLENWSAALEEYTSLLEGDFAGAPTTDDLHNLSNCALRADEPQMAVRASEYALQIDPEDGLAHCTLGRGLAALGDPVRAEEHLTLATQYAPALAESWLSLARLQKETGRAQQALETLRAGTLAAAENPDIYLELGEAYQADWEGRGSPAPTQAAAMFQHAYDLACTKVDQGNFSPAQMQIAPRLGQTLLELGHTQEARDVLEPAFQNDPAYPGLARTYARSLIALGEPDRALPALRLVIDSSTGDLDDYLDYGRALLSIHAQPDEAVRALRQVLAWNPGHVQATGLLAEALAASGDYEAALEAFQHAMETSLVDDPAWCSRLSLGLGKTALELGQPEIAMASLQEAAQADPSNPQIQCALAEAYEASDLLTNALQAARIALRLDPDEVDTLVWFADKAIQWTSSEGNNQMDSALGATSLQIRSEAVNALRRAIQLDPTRTDLLVKLGKAQCLIGEQAAAAETFRQLITIDEVSIDDLHQAARSLLELGDAVNAVACLEHALLISRGGAFVAAGPGSLPYTLIDAYMAAGNPQAALKTVEQVLAISEKDLAMFRYKTSLLVEMGRLPEALACLESALEIEPQGEFTGLFHYQAALIQRALGNLPAALAHLDKVLAPDARPLGSIDPAARNLAAELSYAMLLPDKACAWLGVQTPTNPINTGDSAHAVTEHDQDLGDTLETSFNGFCLRAELALDLGEELQVAEEAARTAKALVDHCAQPNLYRPRLLAVQSRILARHGESSQALVALKQAIALHEGVPDEPTPAGPFKKLARSYQHYTQSLAAAALELAQWEPAQFLWRQVSEHAPREPLPHLQLAATLVSRAEAQRLCEEAELVNHVPGKSALAEYAHQVFDQEIECAATCQPINPGNPLILRWQARGRAIFEPSAGTAQVLANLPIFPHSPEDVAAHIANLRSFKDNILANNVLPQETNLTPAPISPASLAAQVARVYPQHPLVLIQLALTLAAKGEYIKDALTAAQAAVKAQVEKGSTYPPAGWLPPVLDGSPAVLVNAVLASIAFKAGDLELASQAIEIALAGWFDEPRWQALAANIQNARCDVNLMVTHLEQASNLDPDNTAYLMALGEAYQLKAQGPTVEGDENPLSLAIRTFEKASNLAPDQADPWLALAGAHRQANDLVHAASCAEQAIRLAPDQARPLLMRAEIALQAGDAQQAHDRAQAAVLLDNNSVANHGFAYQENLSNPVLLLARSLISLDRPEEALDILEKTLPTAQEPLPLLLERVQLLRKARGAQAADEALNDLSQNFPDEPLVLAPLAKLMAENNQTDSAIRLAQRSLQAAAALTAVRGDHLNLDTREQVEMHILLGRLLRQTGQLDQALHHLNEAIHLDPQLLEPYLELGRAHQERRQLTQALKVYDEATNIAPKDPRPYFQAGLALKESKDYLAAENMLRRAAALAPNDLSIHRQLGAVVALNLVHNRRRTNVDL